MRFITITTFTVAGRLVQALAIARPVPNLNASGMAIPLARHSSFLDSNESMNLDAISSHGISVREKILSALENYEVNTGKVHPFAVNWSKSGLGTRGVGAPLTTYQNENWMAQISIGTPPKILKVQIDTGAADMWVLQTGCRGIQVSGDRALWDPQSSESSEDQALPFLLAYGDGTIISGNQYVDKVTIAGLTANQIFGSAASYTSPKQDNANSDGLLGLAYPSVSKLNTYPLLASLVKQGKLIDPTFSLKLSSPGAELYIGGVNNMLYTGDISFTPVTNPGLWQVSMDDVRVANGKRILINVPVIIDTGTTYIFGDSERVSELYRGLGGTVKPQTLSPFDFYYLPCNSFPTLSFTFGGTSFDIPPEDLRLNPINDGSPNCFSAIVGHRTRVEYWNIGTIFLQGVYSVFDYTTERVGFAKLA